eukprot:SAG31_NODE_2553_length_5503_cov_24.613064_3_plen_80_part_00
MRVSFSSDRTAAVGSSRGGSDDGDQNGSRAITHQQNARRINSRCRATIWAIRTSLESARGFYASRLSGYPPAARLNLAY